MALTQSLAVELAPFGIMVNAVGPGIIEAASANMAQTRSDPEVLRHDLERTPLGRFGRPAEIAQAVLYLCNATWMTGQTLYVDGGFLATGLGYWGASRSHLLARQ
jgi:NAD(P)-dependent dehydrogenase (short-subunit alcohol dehydrogenase family)